MLKIRVIPTMLYKSLGLVKGKQFDSNRRVGTALPSIKVYEMRNVDELVLLDIDATNDGDEPDYENIESLSLECFVPFSVGGGISDIEHARQLFRVGADKIVVNTAAFDNPDLINHIVREFGSQAVIVSVDAKKIEEEYFVVTNSGQQVRDMKVVEWVQEVERRGAGEILITSIDRDGMMNGYDIDLCKLVTSHVKIPVIASGGAGCKEDFLQVISEAGVDAVAAASIFHFTQLTPNEIKQYLKDQGLPIRL